ncbi:M20/M25/M40 family metallo-hydrolase [Aliikangiella coralliicola]|uniref:M20/M25/M40 family metallo-hydrolase n=1 Tax=Aliikangiella coralliicola TaxID=2592383 RepID=A0A545UGY8_9GAMM|nr:M20/M25/M40 family metallo-hydrolase [Aliikangiella coralliicola]TQV88732.1 M20/M25/M40 family metallo-hydrolase [Aliikangiella coralliicola]
MKLPKSKSLLALYALLPIVGLTSFSSSAEQPTQDKKFWITIGSDAVEEANEVGAQLAPSLQNVPLDQRPVLIYQLEENQLGNLSTLMHDRHHRCGGYIVHNSYQEAVNSLKGPSKMLAFDPPPIQHQTTVNNLLPNIQASQIRSTIVSLSEFTNRFYNTSTGEQSADWLADHWRQMANSRSWATVEPYNHSGWRQDSVILKVTGSQFPDEIIVIGGHLDSTAGSGTREGTRAPGADDDASGIASLTNVAKVLLENGHQPQRTIHFMGYAAEEVGLRGSQEIAGDYKRQGKNVVAVLQLDMTNYHGSTNDIYFMTDYVDASFNSYMQRLLDTYQPQVTYGTDRCGYGCSDHASWYNQGFPTSMPFEASFNGRNRSIHTPNDTLARSDSDASNSVPFAKLALSFAVEMGNPSGGSQNTPPSANISNSCNELTCQFDGSASTDPDGSVQSYAWNFGDGSSSTQQKPTHTYRSAGSYNVTLTVTDNEGATGDANKSVTVSDGGSNAPTARIDASCDKLACQFTGSNSSDDGRIVSYEWNFGDSATSSQTDPAHSYATSGSYQVSLKVTDDDGLSDTATRTVNVSDGSSNQCDGIAPWNASVSYSIGDKVSKNNKYYEAIWWSTGADPEVYSQVWKLLGECDDTGTPTAPIAKFSYQVNGLSVTFTDQSSDDVSVEQHAWEFGDGQTSQQANPSHTFASAGSYSVKLTVTDGDNLSDSQTQVVQVTDGGNNCSADVWQSSKVYLSGDKVSHQGSEYTAKWWTQGQDPATNSGPWDVWSKDGDCQ